MPIPTSDTVKYEKRDRVAWVTLNRPEAMNALNSEIRRAITEAFEEVARDDDVLVTVVMGEGGRAFCAGNDLKEQAQGDAAGGAAWSRGGPSGSQAVYECLKPVIAAIDGYALAGGMQLANRCDIRIATEKSRFGMPEPLRSLTPINSVDTMEMGFVPMGEAMWIILTGAHMTAERAYDIGLIQALVPDMVERRTGSIVNVSSVLGRLGTPFNGAYVASKFALEGISESLRTELSPFGVRVALVEPGLFRTEFQSNMVRGSSVDSPDISYAPYIEKYNKRHDRLQRFGGDPMRVARVISKVIDSDNPPFRNPVGIDARMGILGTRLLPEKVYWPLMTKATLR